MLEYLDSYKWYTIFGILTMNVISQLYKLSVYKYLTELIINVSHLITTNYIFLGFFIKLFLIHSLQTLIKYILEKLIAIGIKDIFQKMVTRAMNDPLDFYKKDINTKINQIWAYLNNIEVLMCKLLIDLPIIITFMMYYAYMICSLYHPVLLFIIPANIFIMLVLHPFYLKQYKLQKEGTSLDVTTKHKLIEAIANIEYVRLNNHESHEIQKICVAHNLYSNNKLHDKWLSSCINFISFIYTDFIISVIYSIGVLYITNKWLSPINLLYIVIHTGNFYYQSALLKDIYNYYIKIPKKSEIFHHMLDNQLTISHNNNISSAIETNVNNITYKNVTFSYNKIVNVINNLSFEFVGKNINLLLGPNGCGKSTIIKLLLRLYNSDSGSIYFKGTNINEMSLETLRNNIVFVGQEPNIFNDTVLYNIKYGNETISNTKIMELCDILYSREWLLINQHKQAGFRGKNLSGGEKKKIQLINAMCKAICKNANVIIFDEPTNTLDSTALIWFIDFIKLLKITYDCTIIIITHDIRLKDICDNIVDLNLIK